MEDLIQHYLKRLNEKDLTKEQKKDYKRLIDEYSTLYLQDLYS